MKHKEPAPPYIYQQGDPIPVPIREVLMATTVANTNVIDSVFTEDELTWVNGRVAEIMANPSTWVESWVLLNGNRSAGLKVKLRRTTYPRTWTQGPRTTKGYPYSSHFLMWFTVRYRVMRACLEPSNRARFALELRTRPYEAEILRGEHYFTSVISAVLTENGGLMLASTPTAIAALVLCTHCGRNFSAADIRCSWCGSPR